MSTDHKSGSRDAFTGLRSILVNAGHLVSARFISMFIRLIYVFLLTRFLGPEIYGIFSYAQTWYLSILPITILGFVSIIPREVARQKPNEKTFVETTVLLGITLSLFSLLFCIFIAIFSKEDILVRNLVFVFAWAVFARGIASWSQMIFIGYEASSRVTKQEAFFRILEVAVCTVLLLIDKGVLHIAVAHSIIWSIQAVHGLILVNKHHFKLSISLNIKASLKLLLQAGYIGGAALLLSWILRSPVLLGKELLLSASELGQVGLATQILNMSLAVPQAFAAAAMPVLSRSAKRADGKDFRVIEVIIVFFTLAGVSAVLGGNLFGEWAVKLVFGQSFAQAGALLGLAFGIVAVVGMGSVIQTALLARNQDALVLFAAIAALFTLAVSWLFLKPAALEHNLASSLSVSFFTVALAACVWNLILLLSAYQQGAFKLNLKFILPIGLGTTVLVVHLLFVPDQISHYTAPIALIMPAVIGIRYGLQIPEIRNLIKRFQKRAS